MAETKNLEINVKIKIKKMPIDEYEAIMKPYRRNLLQFEKSLRQLADQGVISYKILDEFSNKFNFIELQRLKFAIPDEPEAVQPVAPQPEANQPQSGYNFGESQPQAQPASTFGFGKSTPDPVGFSQATSQKPQSNIETSPKQKSNLDPAPTKNASTGFSSFNSPSPSSEINSSDTPAPSFNPSSAPASTPSFGLSSNFGSSDAPASKPDSKISIGVDEEDRATGIAILRKKMLMELRKIRNVVEEQDDSGF